MLTGRLAGEQGNGRTFETLPGLDQTEPGNRVVTDWCGIKLRIQPW